MASDTTSPDEATDATVPVTQHIRDSHTTDLTSAERRSLARSRKVAFCVLAACAVLAIGGAVYFWYLWFLTAKTCIDTYILKTADSIIIHPELASSWQSYLIGLDISSFSALTLALLFTRLAYVGCRNTIRSTSGAMVGLTSGVPTTVCSSRTASRRSAFVSACWVRY